MMTVITSDVIDPHLGRQMLQASHDTSHDTLLRQNTLSWMDTWMKLRTALTLVLVLVYTPGSFTSKI